MRVACWVTPAASSSGPKVWNFTAAISLRSALTSVARRPSGSASPPRALNTPAVWSTRPRESNTAAKYTFSSADDGRRSRSEEHTSELQSRRDLVCRLLLEKKKNKEYIQVKKTKTDKKEQKS